MISWGGNETTGSENASDSATWRPGGCDKPPRQDNPHGAIISLDQAAFVLIFLFKSKKNGSQPR